MEYGNEFIIKNNKKLKLGFTTGTCAAAAAKAATIMLFTGRKECSVELMTPKGIKLKLEVRDAKIEDYYVSCGVKKDSGDDPDVTNGVLVFAKVAKNTAGSINIDGGIGVGRVTKVGLEQPIGSAAINKVPRQMIKAAVLEICEDNDYSGGINVEISIPQGTELAKKTFNPKLGIEGGISILGTSGIVEPMSEKAIIESIRVEMKMLAANGAEYLLVSPGNYGVNYTEENLFLSNMHSVKCSNYVGEAIDMASEIGFKGILFISHIGKFIKVAGGIMNTHSSFADARMEIMAANAILAGASTESLKEILKSTTTDEAIAILEKEGLKEKTMYHVIKKIQYYLRRRAYEKLEIGAIIFSNEYGLLAQTENVEELLICMENYTE